MNTELERKMLAYYRAYYKAFGHPDFEKKAQARLNEEDREAIRLLKIQRRMKYSFTSDQKHCVVGAGTGGLAMVLHKNYHCQVYGIDPNAEELAIIHDKCRLYTIPVDNFKKEQGEHMSFPTEMFDVVHCYTVLEHVQDVAQCIKEMIRVTKKGGIIHIHTPNYNFPREGHYKIIAPTFLGKFVTAVWLVVLGKSPRLLRDINFVTPRKLNNIFSRHAVTWSRWFEPAPASNEIPPNIFGRIEQFIFNYSRQAGVYPHQDIIIYKPEK